MPHGHACVPGAVTDAHASFLRTVTDLLAHAGAGVTHVAGAVGDAMTGRFRALLDALAEAFRPRVGGHAGHGKPDADRLQDEILAIHGVTSIRANSGIPHVGTQASLRLEPASRPDFKLASMNSSRSPSSTFCVSVRSTPVRRSLMRLWSST